MLSPPKNRTELLKVLTAEKDFRVLHVVTGKASDAIEALRKLSSKRVSVIVIETR